MQTRTLVAALFGISVLSVACGGGSKVVSPGMSPGGEGDDPATPFQDAAVKASLRDAPGNAACGVPAGTTMGAHFDAQKQALKGDGVIVEESFRCRARADNNYDCEWSVYAKTEAAPTPPPADRFMIMARVGGDGRVDMSSVHCGAPG